MNQSQPVQTIDYATSTPLSSGRVWAAAILALTGLGLIGLGGCFLIGVLILFNPSLTFGPSTPPPWTWGTCAFAGVLSLLAAICFIFGSWLLWSTTHRLLHFLSAVQVESMQQGK
jgi:hypothetical protein